MWTSHRGEAGTEVHSLLPQPPIPGQPAAQLIRNDRYDGQVQHQAIARTRRHCRHAAIQLDNLQQTLCMQSACTATSPTGAVSCRQALCLAVRVVHFKPAVSRHIGRLPISHSIQLPVHSAQPHCKVHLPVSAQPLHTAASVGPQVLRACSHRLRGAQVSRNIRVHQRTTALKRTHPATPLHAAQPMLWKASHPLLTSLKPICPSQLTK